MKTYRQIPEDAEYRELYDSYRRTVDNLNDTDFLYNTMLSNGQVFFKDDEVYGFVNGQPALRNRNLVIPKAYIDDFRITNFILYTRMTNELITLDINCNLADYRDNKVHYLYVVLDHHGTYEVYDDMFQSDEYKILFARFIIDDLGDSIQFYMMLPFAGSADYIKGTQFFQVTDGLRVKVVNANTKQITLSKAKIRFSAINFDDKSSPDCITIDHDGNAVPIRYVYWDAGSNLPRANWQDAPTYNLNLTTIMNYSTGRTSRVPDGSFSLQKLYYDPYERCIIALYGDTVYSTREEAIYAIDRIMNYPLPDGIEYLIPIACIIAKNTSDPIDETNFRIVNLDYNEQEVLDSDTFTRQQSAEAVQKARQAIENTETLSGLLSAHTTNRNNPHQVRLNQLYTSRGDACTIDDSFAEDGLTVNTIISRALNQVSGDYYSKRGGTISGSATITGTLTVNGSTTLNSVTMNSGLSIAGNITFPNSNVSIGNTTYRLNTLYANVINATGDSTFGKITTGYIVPKVASYYNIGNSENYFAQGFFNNLSVTGSISDVSTFSMGRGSGDWFMNEGTTYLFGPVDIRDEVSVTGNNMFSITNGYLVIGNYSLRLGGEGRIPTQNGYGIW